MPGPVSRIDRYCPPALVQPTLIVIVPPCGVNLIALREQVERHLAHRLLVGPDARQIAVELLDDGDVAPLGAHRQQVAAFLDHAGQRHRFLFQLVAARLDPRQVEDLVDQHQQMLAARMDVVGIVLVDGDRMGAEQLRLHHLREAEDGVERRAQLVAHRRQEARLGEIGALGAPPRLVGIELGLLELGDQRVLFRLERQAGERGAMQPVGEDDEVDEDADAQRRHQQRLPARRRPEHVDDRDRHRQQAAGDGEGNRRGDHRRHARDQQQDDQHERAGVGVGRLQQQDDEQRPGAAGEGLGDDEFAPPGGGGLFRLGQIEEGDRQPVAHRERNGEQHAPGDDLGRRHPGSRRSRRPRARPAPSPASRRRRCWRTAAPARRTDR